MNVVVRLEYELAYYDSAVQLFNHNILRICDLPDSSHKEYEEPKHPASFPILFKWQQIVDSVVLWLGANSQVLLCGLDSFNSLIAFSLRSAERPGLGLSLSDVSPERKLSKPVSYLTAINHIFDQKHHKFASLFL